MSTERADPGSLERLSALVDGELDDSAVARACAHWREDAAARSSWHAWQVIGDVLRSDELACGAHRNADFMSGLRARLASEAVVFAPEPASAPVAIESATASAANGWSPAANPRPRRWSWMAPSAVAAGFVVVAGVVMVTRGPDPAPAERIASAVPQAGQVAAAAPAPTVVPVAGQNVASTETKPLALNPTMIRDARLDRYLAAHKQFAGSSVLAWPSASLRNANVDLPSR